VCFDEDVTVENIDQACSMGFDTAELAKRFTAAGTGPGQGGIPGHNLPLVIEQRAGSNTSQRPTTVRSPLTPTLIATYAGNNHDMVKRTPLDDQQHAAGGIFRRIGAWQRARYFSEDPGCRDEISAVRKNVGLIDVSTLGKFRIFGPDAEKVLQRIYAGNMADIRKDKVKYATMCNEDGCLLDDGIVVQRGPNDYYFTTSTGRAGNTVDWIGFHTRYDGWDFHLTNLTDALGAINLAGPKARDVLTQIADIDISNESFPYLGYREFFLKKILPIRVLRLGFVGELSFEIHMPASYAQTVWNLLMQAGRPYDIRPFGLEAQNCLRLEKGHIIIGQESEIRTTLHDLGLGFLWYRHKPEAKTVGSAALRHTEHQPGRLKLVGFKTENSRRPPKDGSIIVDTSIRGHVCTARHSFALDASIGLALVDDTLAKEGTRLEILEDDGGDRRLYATVVPTPFYDPKGKRVRM
jgi:sarcosine oxidase subunit alpha